MRNRLPETRPGVTHRFVLTANDGIYKGYITVGCYADGRPGELFVKMDAQGSTVSGFIDAWAIAVSILLQTGTSLRTICDKFRGMSFEPSGMTDNKDVRFARSTIDYIVRWLELRFGETADTE